MGSGLLFLAMLFGATVTSGSLLQMLAGQGTNADVLAYGRDISQEYLSVYAMRMAAVFTISVSTASLRTAALPRWVSYLGYLIALVLLVAAGEHRWTRARISELGSAGEPGDSLRSAAEPCPRGRGRFGRRHGDRNPLSQPWSPPC